MCLDGSERPGCAGPHRGEAAEPSAQIYEAVVAVGGGGAKEAGGTRGPRGGRGGPAAMGVEQKGAQANPRPEVVTAVSNRGL